MNILSLEFLLFISISFFVYWNIPKRYIALQPYFILLLNFLFYSSLGEGFVFILLLISSLSFLFAKIIDNLKNSRTRNFVFVSGVLSLVFVLAFYKYISLVLPNGLSFIDFGFSEYVLNIVMPLGLSFYTFQSLGYLIDVYWEKYPPESNILRYFTFSGFFPTILSGPILRYDNFLESHSSPKTFDHELAIDGLRNILYGLFKKVVIANTLAVKTEPVFANSSELSGLSILLGLFLFSFQIYADFSGYTDIATGVANLFGYRIPANFNLPYLSKSIAEFWRRWHISLSSWLNEYIFTPLQHSLRNFRNLASVIAIIVTFIICGAWHGATYNFLIWGLLNGIFIVPSVYFRKKRPLSSSKTEYWAGAIKVVLNFMLISFVWAFFQTKTTTETLTLFSNLVNNLAVFSGVKSYLFWFLICIGFYAFDYVFVKRLYLRTARIFKIRLKLSYLIYYFLLFMILAFFDSSPGQFIYFQF